SREKKKNKLVDPARVLNGFLKLDRGEKGKGGGGKKKKKKKKKKNEGGGGRGFPFSLLPPFPCSALFFSFPYTTRTP
ncbi:hypothetical protein, partial [Escherichia coli]